MLSHFRVWLAAALFALTPATFAAAGPTEPHEVLRSASDRLFAVFKSERDSLQHDPRRIYALVDNTLGPYVDFPLVSQLVLGKHWRTATAAQRDRFTTEFHHMLVRFYTGAFVDDPRKVDEVLANSDTVIRFLPAELNPDGVRATVPAEVHLPSGQVVPVAFAVHHRGTEWKVYDVTVDGISMITNYRSSFASDIQQAGLEEFIARLSSRNREFLEPKPKSP